jgi:L-fucose dehydrogenase
MDLHLSNKVVIVTGGAKGIGRSVCELLAGEGAIPVIMDMDRAAGDELAAKLKAPFIEIDLNDDKACQNAVLRVGTEIGKVYGLVNNAGKNDSVGLAAGTSERFLQSMRNNVGHFYSLAHHSLNHLKETKGAVVNIASKVALTGQGNTSGYAAAKGAVLALTREWAVELLPFGIRVNAVVPAEVWTPLYESWISTFEHPDRKKKEIESRIPLGKRMTTPAEIADTVVFLLSSRASHLTGQWVHTDGGYTHLDRSIL